jgi:hypothetical protein
LFSFVPLHAQGTISQETNIKAVFIYNFTKYIQWNDSDNTTPFIIGVVGDSDIILPLQEIAEKRIVDSRKIVIEHYEDVSDLGNCHILYIPPSEVIQLDEIIIRLEDKNTLTVADYKGAAENGAMIDFFPLEGKIKFELNSRAIENAGLIVSSQLKNIAILVNEE